MGHDVVVEISAEFTIEPFVEGAPGPHVRAAIDVAEAAGLAARRRVAHTVTVVRRNACARGIQMMRSLRTAMPAVE